LKLSNREKYYESAVSSNIIYLQALLGLLNNVHVGTNFTYLSRGTVKKSFSLLCTGIQSDFELTEFLLPRARNKKQTFARCLHVTVLGKTACRQLVNDQLPCLAITLEPIKIVKKTIEFIVLDSDQNIE